MDIETNNGYRDMTLRIVSLFYCFRRDVQYSQTPYCYGYGVQWCEISDVEHGKELRHLLISSSSEEVSTKIRF